MKHLNIFLVAILFIVGVGVSNAQDKNNPWSIEVGVNAVDFFPIEKTLLNIICAISMITKMVITVYQIIHH